MACPVMACPVMAYTVMALIVMAYIVMAYIVMVTVGEGLANVGQKDRWPAAQHSCAGHTAGDAGIASM